MTAKRDSAPPDATDAEVLAAHGWEIISEDPLEISKLDYTPGSSRATRKAAYLIIEYLRTLPWPFTEEEKEGRR